MKERGAAWLDPSDFLLPRRVGELASGLIGIQVPGNRLRVRVPCPPLLGKRLEARGER
jgi:hypothetical protein